MLTLEDIEDRQTREKIKKVQSILPWASVMLCKSVLLESKGAVNGACFILSEIDIDLSDNEESIPKREDSPHKILESSNPPSYELHQDPASGFSEVLLQSTVSMANYSHSTYDHRGHAQMERKHGEAKKKGKVYTLLGKQEVATRSPLIDETAARTTKSIIRGYVPASHKTSNVFWSDGNKHPFYRIERSAEDMQRMAFTANAVIRAACAPAKSAGGEKYRRHYKVNSDGDIIFPGPSFKVFTMSHGRFDKWQASKPVNDGTYIGTNRGHFIPSPWMNAQDSSKQGFLQTINVQGQYKKFSLEELRLGDYVRGRTKAPHLFSLFRKLPTELRVMIWKFARTPRVVELRFNTSLSRCWTPCAPPVLLHVSRESRTEMLRLYRLSFTPSDWAPRIYFDGAIDTLFISFEMEERGLMHRVVELIDDLETYSAEDLFQVQNLAIDEELWAYWNEILAEQEFEFYDAGGEEDEEHKPVLACLPTFRRLKELKIVRNTVFGLWKQESRSGDGFDEDDFVDEDTEFVPLSRSEFRDEVGHAYCECTLRKLKRNDPEWSMPVMGYMEKVSKN